LKFKPMKHGNRHGHRT